MSDGLPVTLYGTTIGTLGREGDGKALLRWSAEAEHRWGLNASTLSHNLRVGKLDATATESFFGALLPEGQWLANLAREVKVTSSDLVGLLTHVGADLAGALSVGDAKVIAEPRVVDSSELNLMLERASGFLVGGGGSALPGFQRKLTLSRLDGRWMAGNGALASTHILKPVSIDQRAAVEGEHYTLSIARALGLAEFETWVEEIADRAVLVVQRYDRVIHGDRIERIHQEDLAQALGLPWGGNDKFEFGNATANLRAIAEVLDVGRTVFDSGPKDVERLLRYVVLNIAAGNTDAHAKNFSILRTGDGKARLAPYYDAAPLALAYGANTALAMTIAGESQLPEVTVDHLVDESTGWGIDRSVARAVVETELAAIVEATHSVRAHSAIEAHVPGYIRGQAQNLLAGKPARIPSAVPLMSLPRIGSSPKDRLP